MVLITILNGVYNPTYNWGAPSCGCEHGSTMESPVCWGIIGPTVQGPGLPLMVAIDTANSDLETSRFVRFSVCTSSFLLWVMSCYLAPTSVKKNGQKRPVLQALPTNYNQSCA